MSALISGISEEVIATLRDSVTLVKDEDCTKVYFSVGESKVAAAQAIGLTQDGDLWFLQTKNDYAIGELKRFLQCDVVAGPSSNNGS